MKLHGACAVVTGGASGIGAATVRLLREAGATVAVLDRTTADVDADHVIECDVADEEVVAASFREAYGVLGALDLAVLAAGVGGFSPVSALDLDAWDRVHAVNVRGAAVCMRESIRAMRACGHRGAIVAVSSISARVADRGLAHYGSSKAALDHLVRITAREVGQYGIRVNGVAPGTTDTAMFTATDRNPGYRDRVVSHTPLGRLGTADDVAEAILAIARLDWVTGQTIAADGGQSLWSPIDPIG